MSRRNPEYNFSPSEEGENPYLRRSTGEPPSSARTTQVPTAAPGPASTTGGVPRRGSHTFAQSPPPPAGTAQATAQRTASAMIRDGPFAGRSSLKPSAAGSGLERRPYGWPSDTTLRPAEDPSNVSTTGANQPTSYGPGQVGYTQGSRYSTPGDVNPPEGYTFGEHGGYVKK